MERLTAEFGGSGRVGTGVGPVLEKFDGVSRIVVLRGGGLGDLIFAFPAMAALKAAYPGARITLPGTPVHQEIIAATAPWVFPECGPGSRLPRPGCRGPRRLAGCGW
jgi:hypothetical protein